VFDSVNTEVTTALQENYKELIKKKKINLLCLLEISAKPVVLTEVYFTFRALRINQCDFIPSMPLMIIIDNSGCNIITGKKCIKIVGL
jgi:hypothetical protein